MRRLPLILVCTLALFVGISYLPSSSPAAGRGVEARDETTSKLREGANDVKYALERMKRELEGLIP